MTSPLWLAWFCKKRKNAGAGLTLTSNGAINASSIIRKWTNKSTVLLS
jgi:hypothetical protein